MRWGIVFIALLVTGCETPPPVAPDARLAEAPDWAMRRAIGPSDVPINDGDPNIRRPWQANERENHAQCVARQHTLVDHLKALNKE